MYVVLTLTGLRYQLEKSALKSSREPEPLDLSSKELKLESDQLEV